MKQVDDDGIVHSVWGIFIFSFIQWLACCYVLANSPSELLHVTASECTIITESGRSCLLHVVVGAVWRQRYCPWVSAQEQGSSKQLRKFTSIKKLFTCWLIHQTFYVLNAKHKVLFFMCERVMYSWRIFVALLTSVDIKPSISIYKSYWHYVGIIRSIFTGLLSICQQLYLSLDVLFSLSRVNTSDGPPRSPPSLLHVLPSSFLSSSH